MFDFVKLVKDVFIKSVPDTSNVVKVATTDIAKLIKTGVLVGAASALSFLVTNLDPALLGPYQPLVIMGLTVVLDFVNKLIKPNTPKE